MHTLRSAVQHWCRWPTLSALWKHKTNTHKGCPVDRSSCFLFLPASLSIKSAIDDWPKGHVLLTPSRHSGWPAIHNGHDMSDFMASWSKWMLQQAWKNMVCWPSVFFTADWLLTHFNETVLRNILSIGIQGSRSVQGCVADALSTYWKGIFTVQKAK
jgi:hypothetical protein